MAVYEYNSTTVNLYSEEDCGLLTSSSLGVDDYGDLSSDIADSDDNYYIDCNETLVPFGGIKVTSKKVIYTKKNNIFEKLKQTTYNSILLTGVVFRWIGFSVIFQLSNDLCRNVIPDVSGGGKSL